MPSIRSFTFFALIALLSSIVLVFAAQDLNINPNGPPAPRPSPSNSFGCRRCRTNPRTCPSYCSPRPPPRCQYSCPTRDRSTIVNLDGSMGNPLIDAEENGGTPPSFTCYYRGGGTCSYDDTNGMLVAGGDNDDGNCPFRSQSSCTVNP